ncbi:cysteine proteinase [Rostrohypoxylon terebratum]|nr:cysteine proteinase [Rostrohypoxylon terebratum]
MVSSGSHFDSSSPQNGYEDLGDESDDSPLLGREPSPDEPPKDVNVGAINPYALVEAMIGHKLDRHALSTSRIISDVLQTNYEEPFDLTHNSVLFAGLKLNEQERQAEQLSEDEIQILEERDLVTPDLSRLMTLNDLEKIGLKEVGDTRIRMALSGRTVGNKNTETINDLVLSFHHNKEEREWTPPNSSWRDTNEAFFRGIPRRLMMDGSPFAFSHNLREQAASNCWLIAAIFSVFWANPAMINRSTRMFPSPMERSRRALSVKFHDKGGRNNAETATIEVDYYVPAWPALYEKAFVKWITKSKDCNRADLTQAHNGDPVKAMSQINGRETRYYFTGHHSAAELAGLVRACSVNKRTISPMAAWTHATGDVFRGSDLDDDQYIIVRNPWGVTEPRGLTSYLGLLDRVEPEYWPPAALLDRDGVLSIKVQAFKKYFACIGVAK